MTKQETTRLLAYDNAKRNRPRTMFASKRDAKSLKFTTLRYNRPDRLRKRLIISTELLGLTQKRSSLVVE